MITEIRRESPIRVLEGAKPAAKPVAEREKTKHGLEIPPGSIAHLAEPINNFFGRFPDSTPIETIVRIDSDSDARYATVKLLGKVWQEIGATEPQLTSIRALFRNLYSSAPDIDTFGKIRQACKAERIIHLSGLSDIAQIFLQVGFEKRLQVLQGGSAGQE